jgi:hypothetical protein
MTTQDPRMVIEEWRVALAFATPICIAAGFAIEWVIRKVRRRV